MSLFRPRQHSQTSIFIAFTTQAEMHLFDGPDLGHDTPLVKES